MAASQLKNFESKNRGKTSNMLLPLLQNESLIIYRAIGILNLIY